MWTWRSVDMVLEWMIFIYSLIHLETIQLERTSFLGNLFLVQSMSGIRTSLIWLWLIGLRFESISNNDQASTKPVGYPLPSPNKKVTVVDYFYPWRIATDWREKSLFQPVVNFINILQAAFAQIFFFQKIKAKLIL